MGIPLNKVALPSLLWVGWVVCGWDGGGSDLLSPCWFYPYGLRICLYVLSLLQVPSEPFR